MDIHVYIHNDHEADVLHKLDRLLRGQGIIMARVDDLNQELVEINAATNEIASDMDDLIAKVGTGLTEAEADGVKAQLATLKAQLTGIASKHTV